MNWQIIFNPFIRFSEKWLLTIGIISAIAGSTIAVYCGVRYDGVIDVHTFPDITFVNSIKENLISITLLTFLLFVLGKIINPKTRFIDILNSSLLFRIPFYVSALLTSVPAMKTVEKEVLKNINTLDKIKIQPFDLAVLLIISILLIALLIYAIVLLFQGFKTATNAKKPSHYISFTIALILAEVLSKIILSTF
ncbi:hypothetical protein L1S35_08930 [Flavobacterium sp. AS60]|uniref:hypothetical protein n=1 Tax=Flavobacterium anseongense TaxID=2910677 RepID=UPI001F367F61|nr:hypothetical protein [Flavobacterium sp. AS60]MCF6129797.1 hypothetical protein [Flavobacterium sp. AS60]